jgi:hypothetical protein
MEVNGTPGAGASCRAIGTGVAGTGFDAAGRATNCVGGGGAALAGLRGENGLATKGVASRTPWGSSLSLEPWLRGNALGTATDVQP